MKRYIKEMRNDLVREYPGIDEDRLDLAAANYRRGMIPLRELLREFADAADEAAHKGRPLTLDLSVLWG